MVSSSPPPLSALYYVAPLQGDFRQGDIYRGVLHLMLSDPAPKVLRRFERPGRTVVTLHDADHPPQGGFWWESRGKEHVQAEGQLGMGVVLTHDCEIENDDSRHHRLIGLLRPLEALNERDREIIVGGGHYGRLYLPPWPEVGLGETYLDLRRITTVRQEALLEAQRLASMTDFGRDVLQRAVIRYLTEMHRSG